MKLKIQYTVDVNAQ